MNRIFIKLGPITIYWYSITMLTSILVGVYLSLKESKKQNMYQYINDLLWKLIVYGIIGARIYYVIFNFSLYKNDLLSIFKIWEGGIAIYGAIIAGLITILYDSHKNKKKILTITDIIVPGLIIAQAIGRWGNFFNSEAHGDIVTLQFLQKLHIPNFIIKGMYINGNYYQPTFLYESLWCLLGFIILIILRKLIQKKEGILTFSYFIWYGIGRLYIEGLRTDSLYLKSFRVSQLVSIVLILIGLVGLIVKIKRGENYDKRKI